jgi:hypothetical protein
MENVNMLLSFDNYPLAVLRRKKEALEKAIRVLEEYQEIIGAVDGRTAYPADAGVVSSIELLLEQDFFPAD